ncbi:MAG: ATPase, T2SS/T4P/T4SS family, partial [Candidatus Omnitrophota bacterium]
IHAALTGHLVFSSLHTNDAAGAVTRLMDMGVEPYLISSSLIAVLAQRLVRNICPDCREEYLSEGQKFFRGKGCVKCLQSGYKGRIGIYEFLPIDDAIKELITAKAPMAEIKKLATSLGMLSLYQDGLQKAKEGKTTLEEVLRVTQEI